MTFFSFKILEYVDDLKYYYNNGYGNPIGETMGCPIVKDLIDNFKYAFSWIIIQIIIILHNKEIKLNYKYKNYDYKLI